MAFDGPNAEGAEVAAGNVCCNADDTHGSSDYRKAMAVVLTRRCLTSIQG